MFKDSFIFQNLNKLLSITQEKCSYLYENSFIMQNIDNLIFASIIAVFALSTFASSDSIGYIALITIFLTVVKLFLKKGETVEGNLFELLLFVYFLIVVVSLSGSSMFHLSLKGFLKTFTYLGFYFSAVQYYKNNISKIYWTIAAIALCVSFEGVVGLFQNFSQVEEISTWQDVTNINPEDVMTRVYGLLQPLNPNLLGGYLVAGLPCIMGVALIEFFEKRYKTAITAGVLTLVTIITLVLTGCRGAYVGLFVIISVAFAILAKFVWESNSEKLKNAYLTVIGAVVGFVSMVVLFVGSVRTRIFSIFAMRNDSSTSFRLNVYQSAFNMAKDNWLFGIGIGNQNFREIYGLYMKTGFDALSAYNIFLEIALESGIFALLAFLAFVVVYFRDCVKYILASKNLKNTILISVSFVSVAGVMVHGFVDTVFFRPQVQFLFWTMVAFVSSILKSEET